MNYYIGIDLGGTNIAVGVVDENYNIIGRGKRKTVVTDNPMRIVDDMVDAAKEAVSDAGLKLSDIKACGVGSPGSIDCVNGIIYAAHNLKIDKLNIKELMEERLNVPTLAANDANAAALGEMLAGAGKGSNSFVIITLGTGVGGGVIMNGKMLVGHNFAGGELGHSLLIYDGEPCSCGRKGCWEAYASATALIRQTKRAMESNRDSKLWDVVDHDITKVNGKTVWDGYDLNDKTAIEVVDNYIHYLGIGILNYCNIFRPEALILSGGIAKQGDRLVKLLTDYCEKNHYGYGGSAPVKILIAELGYESGIIGAASLVL